MSVRQLATVFVVFFFFSIPNTVQAQLTKSDTENSGWFNDTDLSLVLTTGNSSERTLGVSNTLRRVWEKTRFQFDISAVNAHRSEDKFFLVDPGFRFLPGDTPENITAVFVNPDTEPNVENYLIGARFDREITDRISWNTGASWDRNEDAGIINRYTFFAGFGNVWQRIEKFRFATSYGISYTDREEATLDTTKDRRFAGGRVGWDYLNKLNETTVYENELTANMNLADRSDYSLKMTNALSVTMNENMSLKISLQWLYENEPAFEEIDVLAAIIIIDPDNVPGSGDELFETTPSGGTVTTLGTRSAQKNNLDTVFRTALVISF